MKELSYGLKRGKGCHKAMYTVCNNIVIDITLIDISALVSHAKGAKDIEELEVIIHQFQAYNLRNEEK